MQGFVSRRRFCMVAATLTTIALSVPDANAQTTPTPFVFTPDMNGSFASVFANFQTSAAQNNETLDFICNGNTLQQVNFLDSQGGIISIGTPSQTAACPNTGTGNTGGNTGMMTGGNTGNSGSFVSSSSEAAANYVEEAFAVRTAQFFRSHSQMGACAYGPISFPSGDTISTSGAPNDDNGFTIFTGTNGVTTSNDELDFTSHGLEGEVGFNYGFPNFGIEVGAAATYNTYESDFDDVDIGVNSSSIGGTAYACAPDVNGFSFSGFGNFQVGTGEFENAFESGDFSSTVFGGGLNLARPFIFGGILFEPNISTYYYHILLYDMEFGGVGLEDRSDGGVGGSAGIRVRSLIQNLLEITDSVDIIPSASADVFFDSNSTGDFSDNDDPNFGVSLGAGLDVLTPGGFLFGISTNGEFTNNGSNSFGIQTRTRFTF
ncbi:MAG: hypothetical protein AAGA88_13410 [Pseudomonadota bacterium]